MLAPALLAPFLALLACSGGASTPEPAPSRFEAVQAAPKAALKRDDFCENKGDTKAFTFPETAEATAALATGQWTWVNLWATWCRPCVEEMLMLSQWHDKLASEGVSFALRLVSVDADEAAYTAYLSQHPEAKGSARLKDIKMLGPWLTTIGLDASAVLPVHLFVNPSGQIDCVKMGGLTQKDYDYAKAELSGKL